MAVGGQLWYLSQGSSTDGRLAYINSDGTGATTVLQNDGTVPEPLVAAFPQDVAIDTAAGIYYVLSNAESGNELVLLMGHIGSSAAPVVVQTFPTGDLVNAIQIDPVNHRLYVSYTDIDLDTNLQGVIQFNYDASTGATAPMNGTINNSFIVTQTTANIQSSAADGIDVMAPRDFDLDLTTNTLYFTQLTLGDGFESNLLWKIDLDSPTAAAVPVLQQSQFPMDGDGWNFTSPNGFIIDVEVDSSRGLVYFSATEQYPGGGNLSQNAIWYIPTSASGSTAATKVTLSGPGFNAANFYPGDMALDAANHILYVETEQGEDSNSSDDAILVFQLNADGTAATLINTISPSLTQNYSNLAGMTFNSLADLALAQNSAHAQKQADYTLLLADPTITDVDGGYLSSATVKVSGSFAGSGDQFSVAGTTSGVIGGTNITVAITTDGSGNQTLTLTGYDTIAHYEQVLGDLRFFGNNADPTNGGANATRTVTWQVNDGTPGNPVGENVGQTTITIDVANEPPVLTGDLTAAVAEGGSYTLDATDLGYTDTDDVAAGITFTVSNIANGTVLVNGVAATSFTGTQLSGGLVTFSHDGSETTTGSFDVVVDDGNEDSSTPVASTFNFTVTPVNDAPVVTGDLAATVVEGGSYTLTAADLGYTDPDNVAAGITFTVSGINSGTLLVDNVAASTFTATQLADGLVTFVHDGSETASVSFDVVVEDGDADGSTPVASTFNFTVTPVNDAPVLTGDLAATVLEGESYTLTAGDLGYTDVDDAPADVTFTVAGITNGTLLVNNVAASTFTGADLAGGLVSFVHDGGETTTGSFAVVVEDGDEDGSMPVISTFNFTVTPVNDAPVVTGDLAATVVEGGSYTFTAADLGYTDADDVAAGITFTVSGINSGTLLVDNVAASTFTATQLADGLVQFVHDGNELASTSFGVTAEDGNEDGSTPVTSIFTFNVTAVNDAPVRTGDLAATVLEGDSYTLGAADLGYTDTDDVDSGITFTVSGITNGTLQVDGVAATTFTATQLAGGLVTFVHNGGEATTASFNVIVDDGDEDGSTPVASTFNLTVTPVNDAPVLTGDLTATVFEGSSYLLTTADLGYTDADDTAAGVTFTVSNRLNGIILVDGVAQNSFTGAELSGGLVTLDHDGSLTTTGSFDVSVDDGDEDGSAAIASTFNFTVAPPNAPPALTGDLAATVLEGGSYTIVAADLGYTDADDADADVTFTVSSLANGVVLVNGSAATSFTGTELTAGLVTFSHDGSETTVGSFDVVVEDGDEDGSTPVASSFNFAVTSVNDAPAGADKTITVNEDTSYTFSQSDFGFSDGEGDELSAVVITTLSTAGALKLDGVNVVAGQTIAAGDIDELTWKAAKNANGDDYASFTFQVVDDGGKTNGGMDTDADPDTITFDVTEVVDRFIGNRRNNRLTGTDGDDILNGKAGSDKLSGGLGADTFVFKKGHDRDLIRDFDATDADHDTLNLSGVNTIKSFDDLMAHHVAETATGVVINGLHGDRIFLRNVDLVDLDVGDFIIL